MLMQQQSGVHQQARSQPVQSSRPRAYDGEPRMPAADRMSKFQVAFVSSVFGEADVLAAYINNYLCDRRLYVRDWRSACKASSFLTQWMHQTIPLMIERLRGGWRAPGSGPGKPAIPGGSFSKVLGCLFTILDPA